jgi:hypothetical protein
MIDADRNDSQRQEFTLTRFNNVLLESSTPYLVKGIIPRGGLVVVWGPPKCGKSFWTFDVVMHIARGKPYRGRRVQQGAVVYLALEGGRAFHARIEAYKQANEIADAPFYLIINRADLIRDHKTLIEAINEQVSEDAPVAVCIDTLNRSLAGSESKDEDMASYICAADIMREALQCAVIIIHHCGVDGSRPRGHTSLTAAADAQLAAERDTAKNVIVTVEWLKDGQEGDIIVSRLDKVTVGFDEDGEEITSCVVHPVEKNHCQTGVLAGADKKKRESKSLRVFRAAFTEAIDIGGKTIHVRGDGPAVRAVSVSDVRVYFNLRWATGESDPQKRTDAQRKAFKRLIDTLRPEFATWVQGETEWLWIGSKQK